MRRAAPPILLAVLLGACAQTDALRRPGGDATGFFGAPYPVSYRPAGNYGLQTNAVAPGRHLCAARELLLPPPALLQASAARLGAPLHDVPFSPGDLVELSIPLDEDFSGRYVVDQTGRLVLPYVAPVVVAGLNARDAATEVERALVQEGMLRPGVSHVALRIMRWAPIEVTVGGAVFEPGRVTINDPSAERVMVERTTAHGDATGLRSVAEAIRAASGIRPDADLGKVVVLRNGWQHVVDLSGVLAGHRVDDFPLVSGDSIYVPSTGCFQPQLVRPSQITPKGFRVFMSNLIVPASDNSSGAVGRYSTNLPYGTRLLQAAVSANCVGGVQSTNASRTVVLASRNPLTGSTEVVERSVERLLRAPEDELANPYLMPNDAVACYDSAVTNLRDIARTVADLLAPIRLL